MDEHKVTGFKVVDHALYLLNYTVSNGATNNNQNVELLRRSLPYVNAVLADILHVQHKPFQRINDMADVLPVDEDTAFRVMAPGVAMYLAQGENDGDNYNRWSAEYSQRRSSITRETRRIQDVHRTPEW